MNSKQITFNADTRNLGGRKILVDMISKHIVSLQQMKPSLSAAALSSPPPNPAALAMKRQSKIEMEKRLFRDARNEVILKQRVKAVKIQVDSTKPVSFDLIRTVGSPVQGGASSKLYQFTMAEHAKNLASQQRNIGSITSTTTRKKNFYDYTVYPVKINPPRNVEKQQDFEAAINESVRKQLDRPKSYKPYTSQYSNASRCTSATNGTAGARLTANGYYITSSSKDIAQKYPAHSTSEATLKSTQQFQDVAVDGEAATATESSTHQLASSTSHKLHLDEEQRWNVIIEQIPVLLDTNQETLIALKTLLINIIVENRIYRIEEFVGLRQLFSEKNPNVDTNDINSIFDEIIVALEQ